MYVVGVKEFIGKQQHLSDQVFQSLWGVLQKEPGEVPGQQGGALCGSLERDGEPMILRKPGALPRWRMEAEASYPAGEVGMNDEGLSGGHSVGIQG